MNNPLENNSPENISPEREQELNVPFQELDPSEEMVRSFYVRRSSGEVEAGWWETGSQTRNGVEYTRVEKRLPNPKNPAETVWAAKDIPTMELEVFDRAVREQRQKVGGQAMNVAGVEVSTAVESSPDGMEVQGDAEINAELDALLGPLPKDDRVALWRRATARTEGEIARAHSFNLSDEAKRVLPRYRELFRSLSHNKNS